MRRDGGFCVDAPGCRPTLRDMKLRKPRPRAQGTAGFYNFDALLLAFVLLLVGVFIVNGGSRWGLRWLQWTGMAVMAFAGGLFLYVSFLRR